MTMAHTVDKPQHTSLTEVIVIKSELDTLAAVHYKSPVDRTTQMSRYKAVEKHDSEKLNHDWKSEVQLLDEYAGYREQFLVMLIKFQSMWDGYLGQVNIAKHRTELMYEKTQPINSAPYWVGPMTREFKKAWINETPSKRVIKTAQTELAAPTIITPRMDGSLCFCVNSRKKRLH